MLPASTSMGPSPELSRAQPDVTKTIFMPSTTIRFEGLRRVRACAVIGSDECGKRSLSLSRVVLGPEYASLSRGHLAATSAASTVYGRRYGRTLEVLGSLPRGGSSVQAHRGD